MRSAGAEAEEEAVGGDGRGAGDEHRDPGRGSGDRLQEPGAVEAADGAEQLSLGDRFARDLMIREPMKLVPRRSVAPPPRG